MTVLLPDEADLPALGIFGRRLDAAQPGQAAARRYYNDPVAFAADCIDWRNDGLTEYQQEIIGNVPARKREIEERRVGKEC